MKEYIFKLVGAALIGTLSEYLVPKEWKRYVKLVSGILMLSVLMLPLKIDVGEIFSEEYRMEEYQEEGEEILFENVKNQLEENVAADIEKRVLEEFSKKVEARVRITTTSDGKIERVESIEISGRKEAAIEERLKFVYGTDEVIWIKE